MNAAISFPTMRNGASHLNGFDIQIEAIKSMVRGFELGSEIKTGVLLHSMNYSNFFEMKDEQKNGSEKNFPLIK